jgi:hypothetical protein
MIEKEQSEYKLEQEKKMRDGQDDERPDPDICQRCAAKKLRWCCPIAE